MTEKEWLSSEDYFNLLALIGGTTSDRKQRFVSCAYSRLMWNTLNDAGRNAVETAELYAEGEVAHTVAAEVLEKVQPLIPGDGNASPYSPVAWALTLGTRGSSYPPWYAAGIGGKNVEETGITPVALANIVRDIFGNPFRPVALDPAWLTSDVVALAQGIYADRAFDRMPILADALQDAGCDHPDVLAHCRDPNQPHARGCWVVDLLLGKQ